MSDFQGSDDLAPPEAVIATAAAILPSPGAAAADAAHERLERCPNCGTAFATDRPAPSFCPACGQEAVLHPPSVAEFAHEFVGHYVAVDGPLWRTLRLLLTRPGELTREYLRGRRRRYVLPLRLYLSASFLFFLAFKLLPSGQDAVIPGRDGVAATAASTPAMSASEVEETRAAIRAATTAARARAASAPSLSASQRAARLASLDKLDKLDELDLQDAAKTGRIILPPGEQGETPFECSGSSAFCNWTRTHFQKVIHRWRTDPAAAQADFSAHWFGSMPYAVFLMQPVFAGIVGLAYRRRRMLFGEHLVFAMHLHAFWFFALLALLLLPSGLGFVISAGVVAYTLFALRRVYGGRWAPTLARAALVSMVYGVLLGLASMVIAVLAALH